MKKTIFIIIGALLLIVVALFYIIYNYQVTLANTKVRNSEYEKYISEEIQGTQLITLINKTINNNEKNNVQKSENNIYINNEKDSIKLEIKFKEKEEKVPMEAIANLGIEEFVKYYSESKFKCIKKEYHKKTKNISYLLFEEI